MATDDDSDVPESGGVFTFGKSKFADNVPSKFWVRNDCVFEVACGDEHTALVADSGRIFTFGSNEWGQLGLGHTKSMYKPSCIKSLKSEKVRVVGCGRSSTYVATESGHLYSFGSNSEGQLGTGDTDSNIATPQLIKGIKPTKFKMITAGTDHAAALTEDGTLYVWGGGSEGQLGLGGVTESKSPKKLNMGETVVCVSCGYYHTALVTASGALYTFGEGEGGKLGLGHDTESQNTPQQVTSIKGKVIWVACGGSHTIAVTSDGRAYTFGDGSNGQLGHGNIQLQATFPQEVVSLRDTKIRWASCGENHTAVISEKGVLFTFGDGRHGKLGLGEENFANQFKPSPVTRFGAFTVEKSLWHNSTLCGDPCFMDGLGSWHKAYSFQPSNVACGGCHMLVLAKPKMQNGDASDLGSGEEENSTESMGHQRLLLPASLDNLRRSDELDLSGSFSARNRRREKQDPLGSMSRTLPPLNSSFSSRSLPPLAGGLSASVENPLNKSTLPPLHKPVASRRRGKYSSFNHDETLEEPPGDHRHRLQDSSVKGSEESSESDHQKTLSLVVKEANEELKVTPVPAPRLTPHLNPRHTTQEMGTDLKVPKKVTESSEEEEEEEEEEERKAHLKPIRQSEVKTSPTPKPRFARRQPPAKLETSEDEESEENKKKEEDKKEEKTSFRKRKSESEREETEEDNDKTKKKEDKKAKEEKDKKERSRRVKKQRGGIFGKKKLLDSDEEAEDEASEDEEEESSDNNKSKIKNVEKDKKKKDKGKKDKEEKAVRKDKGKKKGKYSEDEEDDEEESNEEDEKEKTKQKDKRKEKTKDKKNEKKNSGEDEFSSEGDSKDKDKEKNRDSSKDKDKDKNKSEEKQPEKKSKLCIML